MRHMQQAWNAFNISLAEAATAPEWVQLLPAGPAINGRDGRSWIISSPSLLVEAFNRGGTPLAIDWEHGQDLNAPNGSPAPAAGWIEALEVRDGELWGQVIWTPRATDAITNREYRFLSPAFLFDQKTEEICVLIGAGLVNRPNLKMVALNQSQSSDLAQGNNSMPVITPAVIDAIFKGFSMAFNKGLDAGKSDANQIVMNVSSNGGEEVYAWLGQFPALREWIGDRVVQGLELHGWTIKNRKFESSIEVPRDKIADDKYGVFTPLFEEMGGTVRRHPDELVFPLLKTGFSTPCYDGNNFFDIEHPGVDENGQTISVSNMQAGDGPAWYLIDNTRVLRPVVWQVREKYQFQSFTRDTDEHVFWRDQYIYGVRARVNAGFGLWQLAFGSKAPLTPDNYAAARASMQTLRGERGRLLGITPSTLLVPPALEADARKLLKATTVEATSNIWFDSAELLVNPYLS